MAGWHWRNTMKPVRFFKFDARAAFTLLLVLLHPREYTLALFLGFLFLSYVLERKGLSMAAATRAFRSWIVGSYRPPGWKTQKRRIHDSG